MNQAFQDEFDEDYEIVPLVPGQVEDDEDTVDAGTSFAAAIGGKDWTVETLVSQMRKGRIDLNPTFQRRNAWLRDRKSKLIESIILGFPIPQIVLAEKRDSPGHFFVLDGKQRLLALRQFLVESPDPRDAGFDNLKLSGLEVRRDLNGHTAISLAEDHPEILATIENYSIRTVVLSSWNSEKLLLSLFLRLNTGSVQLSPHELRQALIPGAFMEWLDQSSADLPSMRSLLGNTHPDRRMVDAELALRFLAFKSSPNKYHGNLKQFLDETSNYYNENWSTLERSAKSSLRSLEEAIGFGLNTLGSDVMCRKWSGVKFERAVNRALFDVQTYAFSFPEVRTAVAKKSIDLIAAFKVLCDTDAEFIRAITATTKTPKAFLTRHTLWRKLVMDVCGVEYDLPRTVENI